MTREEEIKEAAEKRTLEIFGELDDFQDRTDGFIEGAKWADKTMIERARKWLFNNTYKHVDDSRLSMTFENTVDMIDNFCKTMEK